MCCRPSAVTAQLGPSLDPSLPPGKYVIDTWTTEDGLPNATIEAILQTRDGYLWLGTRGGLVRFDGARFTVFDRSNVPGFSSNRVSALLESRDGGLWVGFQQGGLHRLRDGTWEHFDIRHGLSHNTVETLTSIDGEIWIGTTLGVDHWNGETLSSLAGCPEKVRGIGETADGTVWVFADERLMRIREHVCEVAFPDVPLPPSFPGSGILRATRDGNLRLLVAGQMFRVTEDGLIADDLDTSSARVEFGANDFFKDRRGTFWAASHNGLARIADGKSTLFTAAEGLADHRVLSIFEDHEGSLWVGTYTGLNRLKGSRFRTLTVTDGLAEDVVQTALEDSHGNIWIGSRFALVVLFARRCGNNFHLRRPSGGFREELVGRLPRDVVGRYDEGHLSTRQQDLKALRKTRGLF